MFQENINNFHETIDHLVHWKTA